MKCSPSHLRVLVIIILIIAASGLGSVGANAFLPDESNSSLISVSVIIESVSSPDGSAIVATNGLGFRLNPPSPGSSYNGMVLINNPTENDIVIELHTTPIEGVYIDLIDPVKGVSARSDSNSFRIYLRSNTASPVQYTIRSADSFNFGENIIDISINPYEFSVLKFEPMPSSQMRVSGGGSPTGITDVSSFVNDQGIFIQQVTAYSADNHASVTIDAGITGLTQDGQPLNRISIVPIANPPPPPGGNVIALAYDFGPSGATFDSPITITFSYDPADIPPGVNEATLVLGWWDTSTGSWVVLSNINVDVVNHRIRATIDHFTPMSVVPRLALYKTVGVKNIVTISDLTIGLISTFSIQQNFIIRSDDGENTYWAQNAIRIINPLTPGPYRASALFFIFSIKDGSVVQIPIHTKALDLPTDFSVPYDFMLTSEIKSTASGWDLDMINNFDSDQFHLPGVSEYSINLIDCGIDGKPYGFQYAGTPELVMVGGYPSGATAHFGPSTSGIVRSQTKLLGNNWSSSVSQQVRGDTATEETSVNLAWDISGETATFSYETGAIDSGVSFVPALPPEELVFTTRPVSDSTTGLPLSWQPIVAIIDVLGNVVTGSTAPVTLSITSGTGTGGAVLSGTKIVNAIKGIATFNDLSIDKPGTGYTLTATSGALTPITSNPFNVGNAVEVIWPMFRHDISHTGRSPYSGPAGPLVTAKWTYTMGTGTRSSPAIGADGTIYIGSGDNNLYAINPNGSLKWSYTTGWTVRSSPAIGSDGTIYIGSDDNKLYAINPNGSLKWTYTMGAGIRSSPAIGADGTIYVGSDDNKLYAINPDGSMKWNYITGGDIASSPAIGSDGTIYVGSDDNKLYAINPNGSMKWSFSTGTPASSPAIGADGTIYLGSWIENLYAINPNGSMKWSYNMGTYIASSPAIGADGTIYVGSVGSALHALNPNGSLKWSYFTGTHVYSSAVIGSDGTIYIGSYDNKLYALNPDGSLKWSYTTGGLIYSSPAIGNDGTIYVASFDNNLYALNNP